MQAKNILMQTLSKKGFAISLLVITVMVAVTLKIFSVITIKQIIDKVLPATSKHSGLGIRVSTFVIFVSLWFLTEFSSRVQAITLGTSVTSTLSNAVYSAGMRSDINEINKIENNEVVNKVTDKCINVGNFISKTWFEFWKEIISIIALFVAMISIQSLLTTITFITIPLFYMSIRGLEKYTTKLYNRADTKLNTQKAVVSDNFKKIRSIKLKNGIQQEEDKFHQLNEEYVKANLHYGSLSSISSNIITTFFIGLVIAVNLGLGGLLIIQDQMETTVGELVSLLILTPFVFLSLRKVMSMSIYSENIKADLESIDEVLGIKTEIRSEPITNLEDIHSLKFNNVSYTSINGEEIEALTFELKRGEKLGVVSYDGSTNNTIFDLITKLVKPKNGMILINNCDINKLSTFYLREIVTAVPQERCLFNDTIANNIIYPLPFDEYKYNDALNRSGLKDILMTFDKGDDTVLDPQNPLSDSILQRITIANAFYKDSKIFILNEATSSLDIRSEESIMKEIYKLKNKIAIVMSNKVYNVINCDKVLIIDKDQVLEYGKVQELILNKDSLFYSMIKKVKITKATKVS